MRRFQQYVLLALGAALAPLVIAAEKQEPLTPTEIKAAILSRLPIYITWPTKLEGKDNDKFVVGLFDDDGLKPLVETLVEGVKVNGRPIEVQIVDRPEEINRCHVLFVPESKNAEWLGLMKDVNLHGLLTVGESDRFLKKGGVFVFRLNEARRLWVDMKNKKEAGLEIESQFYRFIKPVK